MTSASLLFIAGGLSIAVLIAQYALAYLQSPLKKLPGPLLAKFSDLWRLWSHYSQTHIETQKELHDRYGNVVRIGPNTVSVTNPDLVKTIYSTRGTFLKSDYYSVNDALQDGQIVQNIFGTRSNEFHSKQIKPIRQLYKPQFASELEPTMNDTLRMLCHELEQRFMHGENRGKTCDMAEWISYFAWDFSGDMTFSKRMGFMEKGRDVDGIIATAERVMRYFSVVGQIPALDKLLAKNPYLPFKFPDFSNAAGFCVKRFIERMQRKEQYEGKKDFMNGFLQAKEASAGEVTDTGIIGYLIINILAGADTTGIVLKAIFYHILKSPTIKARLVAELDSATLSYPPNYSTLKQLPYLSACIEEALRIHPVIGHIVERVVPSSGLTLPLGANDSVDLPPGTIIGMNPWIVQRNAEIYGERADEFVPERWLQGVEEEKTAYEVRTKAMKDADMSFGNGNRTCLGQPLATVELYKVTATLFARYKIELEDPSREWVLHKQWFVWPHDIKVKMSRR